MDTFYRFTNKSIRKAVKTVGSASLAAVRAPDTGGTEYFRGTEFRTTPVCRRYIVSGEGGTLPRSHSLALSPLTRGKRPPVPPWTPSRRVTAHQPDRALPPCHKAMLCQKRIG
ncbi:hypothetical protein AMECASPLE_030562 [Ameca splendens]|uniref:Uncharacterized protein n=1 Tax=Ameca splendens TaxID=208324 RepID=A0ABV0Y6E4_9TELE